MDGAEGLRLNKPTATRSVSKNLRVDDAIPDLTEKLLASELRRRPI
jgi:hypothetical protein